MCHGPEQSRPPALVEKGEPKVRLVVGRLTSRKAVTVGLTAIVASNDNDSATPRPRPWLSDLLFSLTNNPIVPVSPPGGGLLTTKPCHSVLSPRSQLPM